MRDAAQVAWRGALVMLCSVESGYSESEGARVGGACMLRTGGKPRSEGYVPVKVKVRVANHVAERAAVEAPRQDMPVQMS